MTIVSEIVTAVSFSSCMVRIPSTLQNRSSSTKWSSWQRIRLCWRQSSSTINWKMMWNGNKSKNSKRQQLERRERSWKSSTLEIIWEVSLKNVTVCFRHKSCRENSTKFTVWNTSTTWSSLEKPSDVLLLNQSVSHQLKWLWTLSTWLDTEVWTWLWVFLVWDNF